MRESFLGGGGVGCGCSFCSFCFITADRGPHHTPHWPSSDRQAGSGCRSFSWATFVSWWRKMEWPDPSTKQKIDSAWGHLFGSVVFKYIFTVDWIKAEDLHVTRCSHVSQNKEQSETSAITYKKNRMCRSPKNMNNCIQKWNNQVFWLFMSHVERSQVSVQVLKWSVPCKWLCSKKPSNQTKEISWVTLNQQRHFAQ